MPATQEHPLQHNPNALELVLVANYRRIIQASLERVWENVLDWEHLPHLHHSSFSCCDLDEAGEWGWRTWSNAEHSAHIELCVDTNRYVARSYANRVQFSEIWTTLQAEGDATAIEVEFYAADEDEAMMQQRQYRLVERRNADAEINLGPEDAVRSQLPLKVCLRRNEFQLCDIAGELKLLPTICPHLLGPLAPVDAAANSLRCPWHGYEFDTKTGACVSPLHARCRLPVVPQVHLEAGSVVIRE
jgi:nitrite reductase/ring-hydroxylating ferredoxin subunit